MRALVTGGTGKVGNAVARALVARGDEVRALVRDPARAAAVLPAGVEPVRGDVTDPGVACVAAAEGCELVFNAMGLPEQWLADDGRVRARQRDRQRDRRARGRAGRRAAGRPHQHDRRLPRRRRRRASTSREVADYPKGTAYERSKQHAERLVLAAAEREGIEVVLANPAAVYGPGPEGSALDRARPAAPVVEGARAAAPALPPGGFGVLLQRGRAAPATCWSPSAGSQASATSSATAT